MKSNLPLYPLRGGELEAVAQLPIPLLGGVQRWVSKLTNFKQIWLGFAFLLVLTVGCGESGPPEPLTDAELPQAMTEAFANASAAAKDLADKAVAAYEGEKYSETAIALEALMRRSDLADEQRTVASQCLLSANEKLRLAQEQGNNQAAKFLKYRETAK